MDCPRGRVKTRSLSSGIQCPCMDSKHWIDRKPFFSVEGETLTLPVMSIIAIGRRLKRRVNEKILKSDSGPDVRLVVWEASASGPDVRVVVWESGSRYADGWKVATLLKKEIDWARKSNLGVSSSFQSGSKKDKSKVRCRGDLSCQRAIRLSWIQRKRARPAQ